MHDGYEFTALVYMDCVVHLSVSYPIEYNLKISQTEIGQSEIGCYKK